MLYGKRVMRNLARQRPRQNKANWHRSVKFEAGEASVRNKANLATGLGEVRQDARAVGGISCTNKANLADRNRDRRAKQSQFGRSNGKRQVRCGKRFMTNWTCPGAWAKQSQFPPTRPARGIWNLPPHAGHSRAGRQVQLACRLAWLPVTWCSFELETRLCAERECSV